MSTYTFTLGRAQSFNGRLQRTVDFDPRPDGCNLDAKLEQHVVRGKVEGWYFSATDFAAGSAGDRVPVCHSPTVPPDMLKRRLPELLERAVSIWQERQSTGNEKS